MKIFPLFAILSATAIAGVPAELEFFETLLPDSKHVSTQILNGELSGYVLSIYEGDDSVESAVVSIEKRFGKTAELELPLRLSELPRLLGEAGLGKPTRPRTVGVAGVTFVLILYEQPVEGNLLRRIAIVTEKK